MKIDNIYNYFEEDEIDNLFNISRNANDSSDLKSTNKRNRVAINYESGACLRWFERIFSYNDARHTKNIRIYKHFYSISCYYL